MLISCVCVVHVRKLQNVTIRQYFRFSQHVQGFHLLGLSFTFWANGPKGKVGRNTKLQRPISAWISHTPEDGLLSPPSFLGRGRLRVMLMGYTVFALMLLIIFLGSQHSCSNYLETGTRHSGITVKHGGSASSIYKLTSKMQNLPW